ncbi:hypothetical protein FPE01S_02_05660 [Flavihumibacter petaseus NBRC 106054]|uniref:Bacterial surface antigen (D15) domain-containing protein n=1 Tax=Flavihumibacter petaseus NBRC 106054 TaxID=1220578 RepID=A0A0E9N1F9_9BACT|nr:hypothetical protein FPE01S_02_05660 [Flavihumibacter petaseus NBRC 106054]
MPLLLLAGCKVTKNYPKDKPFVYKTTVKLNTRLPQAEKSILLSKLEKQVADSLQSRWVTKLFVKQVLNNPPVFDTANVTQSAIFLNDLLKANGYIYGNITWDTSLVIVPKKQQQRVYTTFTVNTGKVMHVDSVGYGFRDSTLQALALVNQDAGKLKKGDTYTKDKIAQELDRLLNVFRNNGYLKISREDIYAEVDTVVAGIFDPGLDPFEQIRLLEEMQKRREDPKIDVRFLQRGAKNPEHLRQYFFRNVSIYPDLQLVQDTVQVFGDTARRGGVMIYQSRNLFKPSFLARNNTIKPGAIYRQDNVNRTNNVFGQMSAWKQVGIELRPIDSIGVVDANINMYPAKRRNIGGDFEVSRNQSDILTSTNLFGIGVQFGLQDRNVSRQSVLSSTNLRFGIELGNQGQIIQTFQTNLSQSFTIPKFVLPFKIRADRSLLATRTILNATAAYTDRRDFYATRSLNTSIAYDWVNRKNRNWTYSPLNIEFVRVYDTDSLRKLYDSIPNLKNLFNDGLIISQYLILRNTWGRGNKLYSLKTQVEESGAIFGMFPTIDLQGRLSRFVRGDIDFRYYVNHDKHSWAFRIFGAMGVPYGQLLDSTKNIVKEQTLPFYKSYFAGGPSSMRGWQIRQLGPGSSKIFANNNADRFADIQLEGNIEYRFDLAVVFGIKLKSALFTDFGNIWYRNNQGDPSLDDAVFKVNKLYRDLAVDLGTSLRLDFNYFLIRFDWAYKFKDPFYAEHKNGWFYDMNLFKGQFQLGINYPF